MHRWYSVHTLAVGALIGFLLDRHLLWACTGSFVAGLLAGRLWAYEARLALLLRERIARRMLR